MSKASLLSSTIGERLRAWRESAGLTQENVARAARNHGFDWKAATVGVIETGRREVSLQELLALPLIVGEFSWVPARHFADPRYFLGSFAPLLDVDAPEEDRRDLVIGASQLSDRLQDRILMESHGQAERNASRVLGVSSGDVAGLAIKPVGQ